jgi:heme-degrading monooxygenase HmoA
MPYTIVHQKVKDFNKWKADFDSTPDARKAGGIKSFQIFQTVDDPNTVVIVIEWDALLSIEKFMQSAGLAERQQRAGVIERCATYDTSTVLEEVEKSVV